MEAKKDDPRYRWNLFVSAVLHVLLIGAVMMWAAFAPKQADQPVWLELGMGGEAGGGSGSEGGGSPGPSQPSTTPSDEPAPAPPGQPNVAEEASKPAPIYEPVKHVTPPKPKEDTHQPVVHMDQPKKIEKQPKPETKPQPPHPTKVEDNNKIKISNTVVQRPKPGVQNSTAVTSKGTGPPDSKGKNPKLAGRSFNADAFKRGMLGKLGYGSNTGTGPGTGNGNKSGPGQGKGSGQYAGLGTGPGNRPGTGGGPGTGPGTGGGLPSEFGWYYQLIKDAMDHAWTQPSQLQGHLTCVVFIRIQRDGTITNVWFDRKSGNPVMDDTVVSAVNSVGRIRPLPPGLGGGYADIPVEFELKPKGHG